MEANTNQPGAIQYERQSREFIYRLYLFIYVTYVQLHPVAVQFHIVSLAFNRAQFFIAICTEQTQIDNRDVLVVYDMYIVLTPEQSVHYQEKETNKANITMKILQSS